MVKGSVSCWTQAGKRERRQTVADDDLRQLLCVCVCVFESVSVCVCVHMRVHVCKPDIRLS